MIGGFEFEISGCSSRDDKDIMLRFLSAAWPAGVVETSDGRSVMTARQAVRNGATTSQFFVYKDIDAKRSWDEYGLNDANCDKMISVIFEPGFILLISDEEYSISGCLVSDLIQAIRYMRNRGRLVPSFTSGPSAQQVTV
ncbi:hypothetical protein WME91_12555 [Sorangium sp. So ce269]